MKQYQRNFSGEDVPMQISTVNHHRNFSSDDTSNCEASKCKVELQTSPALVSDKHAEFSFVKSEFSSDIKIPAFNYSKDPHSSGKHTQNSSAFSMTQHNSNGMAHELLKEHSGLEKNSGIGKQEMAPLDLSEKSSRDDSCSKSSISALQAALIVHQCPYCSHKTYYPEVLWMHKRIWHKVSCNSMAPQWIQQNGFKNLKNNLLFLARNGRTGPPPALAGKECQPLPIARFTRTQMPGGSHASKGNSSTLGNVSKATSGSQVRDNSRGGPRTTNIDMQRQPKLPPTQEQYSLAVQQPPLKSKYEVSPKLVQAGSFTRNNTPALTSVSRQTLQPSSSKQVEKYMLPQGGPSFASPSKLSPTDTIKTKFSLQQPQFSFHKVEPHTKQETSSVPQRESQGKGIINELGTLSNCGAGAKTSPILHTPPSSAGAPPPFQSVKQEPASESHEKRMDILNIFKTYIPKDLATLYQSWGANSNNLDNAGMLRTQARQGDYVCIECGKSFSQPSHLRTHMRSHTGERPFQCRYCSYSASQKGNLKTHVQCVHRVPFDNSEYPDKQLLQPQSDDPDNYMEDQLENLPSNHQVPGAILLK